MPCSRRSLLQRAGTVAGLVATAGAGCLSVGSTGGYKLIVQVVPRLAEVFLVVQPTGVGAETRIDYETERINGTRYRGQLQLPENLNDPADPFPEQAMH